MNDKLTHSLQDLLSWRGQCHVQCHAQCLNRSFFSSPPIYGFADDYAFLIRGLLDLYEACYDEELLKWAEQLQNKMAELFWDATAGGYFNSPADDSSLVLRLKDGEYMVLFLAQCFCIFFLNILTVKMRSENDHQSIEIIHQIKVKDFLVIYK